MNEGYKRWIEDNLNIVDKNGDLVPFRLNAVQEKFLTEDLGKEGHNKVITLKARQQGFSSLVNALFTADFILKPNTYNVVIADDTDNAQGLLKRVKDYLSFWAEKRNLKLEDILKYNSKYELYLPNLEIGGTKVECNSTYIIGTAQNINVGRSKTITNLHLSEAAFYPHFSELLKGVMQAVVPTGRVIMETTANGFNEFKDYWDQAVKGENGFTPLFYRASDFYPAEFLADKKKQLGNSYPQEYPESSQEAFLSSGMQYFNRDALIRLLETSRNPAEVLDYV